MQKKEADPTNTALYILRQNSWMLEPKKVVSVKLGAVGLAGYAAGGAVAGTGAVFGKISEKKQIITVWFYWNNSIRNLSLNLDKVEIQEDSTSPAIELLFSEREMKYHRPNGAPSPADGSWLEMVHGAVIHLPPGKLAELVKDGGI